jgi:hypothetical protein
MSKTNEQLEMREVVVGEVRYALLAMRREGRYIAAWRCVTCGTEDRQSAVRADTPEEALEHVESEVLEHHATFHSEQTPGLIAD